MIICMEGFDGIIVGVWIETKKQVMLETEIEVRDGGGEHVPRFSHRGPPNRGIAGLLQLRKYSCMGLVMTQSVVVL